VLKECLALVKHGVPFDVAFSLSNDNRVAWNIICGEIDGGKFNWTTLNFENQT
jgi:hypothetical protein